LALGFYIRESAGENREQFAVAANDRENERGGRRFVVLVAACGAIEDRRHRCVTSDSIFAGGCANCMAQPGYALFNWTRICQIPPDRVFACFIQ
jgi:hypothetical protein